MPPLSPVTTTDPWREHLQAARDSLILAARMAERTLPLKRTQEHWHRSQASPNAWQEMSALYPEEPVLDALATVTLCLNLLQGESLRTQARERPIDLRLVPMRRTS